MGGEPFLLFSSPPDWEGAGAFGRRRWHRCRRVHAHVRGWPEAGFAGASWPFCVAAARLCGVFMLVFAHGMLT
jgi:hypothetical protein